MEKPLSRTELGTYPRVLRRGRAIFFLTARIHLRDAWRKPKFHHSDPRSVDFLDQSIVVLLHLTSPNCKLWLAIAPEIEGLLKNAPHSISLVRHKTNTAQNTTYDTLTEITSLCHVCSEAQVKWCGTDFIPSSPSGLTLGIVRL